MAVTLAMQYPADPGSSFDWNYFLNHHIPLIETALEIEDTGRIRGGPRALGCRAGGEALRTRPFCSSTSTASRRFYHRWRQQQHRVMGDIVNFTNTSPQVQLSEVIARPNAQTHEPAPPA